MHRYFQVLVRLQLLLILTILPPQFCSSPASAKLLVGGVQQSDYLPAISPVLSNEIAHAAQQPYVNWFPIPRWMSGKWAKGGDVTVSVTDLRSGIQSSGNSWKANRMTRQFGHQFDKTGDVWWALLMPAEQEGEAQQESVEFLVLSLKLEKTTTTELVTRTRYLVSESSGWGVCKQYQQEALNHYYLSGEGILSNRSYNRVFDLYGRPLREAVLISQWRKIGSFSPVQTLHGIDLPQSLNYYLHIHNLSDLAIMDSLLRKSSP
jgi:hypothetical protein